MVLKAFLLYLICRLVLVHWPDLMFLICRIRAFFPGFLFSLAMFLCLFTTSFLVGAVSSVTSSLWQGFLWCKFRQISEWWGKLLLIFSSFLESFYSVSSLYIFWTSSADFMSHADTRFLLGWGLHPSLKLKIMSSFYPLVPANELHEIC